MTRQQIDNQAFRAGNIQAQIYIYVCREYFLKKQTCIFVQDYDTGQRIYKGKNIPKSLPTPGNRILTSTDYRIFFHISKLFLKKETKSIPKEGNCIGLFKKSMWTKKVAMTKANRN